jgi:hypothetical protein
MMISTTKIITTTTNFHTVMAGLSGESITTIGPITCFCFGSAPDSFVATLRFVILVLCCAERPVWQLK